MIERYIIDDAGTVIDKNTRKNYELAYELVDILNHYETLLNELFDENEELKQENIKLKEDLEHCANQFTNDGKNVLLSLR